MSKIYYTYLLVDPRNDLPFYVGKGKNKRMFEHEKYVKNYIKNNGKISQLQKQQNPKLFYKLKSILSKNLDIKYKKAIKDISEQKAFGKEIELIKKIGLENLCNLTYGGYGGSMSEESREKYRQTCLKRYGVQNPAQCLQIRKKISRTLKQINQNPERKKWYSESQIGKKHSVETKQKISKSMKGKKKTKEHKENLSKSHKGKRLSEKQKQEHSECMKLKWQNSIFRKKQIESRIGKHHSEETKRKMSEAKKKNNIKEFK